MTRKLIAVLAAAVLPAVLLAPPARAAETPITVDGHSDLASSGLWLRVNACGNPVSSPLQGATQLVSTTQSSGTTSLGWDFTRAGNQAGPLAHYADTSGLSTVSVRFFSDGFVDGHLIAFFDVYDDATGNTGWYVGTSNKFTFDSDNGDQLTAGSAELDWFLVDGEWNRILPEYDRENYTIAEMGAEWGDHGGVWTGFVLGCNSNAFYLDDLTVGGGATTYRYDLETPQIQSMAHVEYSPDGKVVRNGNVTIKFGQRLRVLGHAHGHHDDVYFQANGALWAQPFGKSWRQVSTGFFDPDYYASFAQRPSHRTVYYFTTGADAIHSAANSEYMVVNVRARASIKILDRTLVEGQRITALGVMRPGNRGQKLKLQRRVNGTWKTFASGRTGRDGKYRFSGVASSPGTWKVRVLVESGNGNLGTKTATRDVFVEKYVPPPPKPDDNVVVYVPPPVPDNPAPPAPDPNRRSIVAARELTVHVGQAPPAR
ncbi:MAG TPA: hypothetical protein VFK41_09600 [Nocardioidaceae bacterium]|nr:hypothetical protein [Nocardioidaceae bacterium]